MGLFDNLFKKKGPEPEQPAEPVAEEIQEQPAPQPEQPAEPVREEPREESVPRSAPEKPAESAAQAGEESGEDGDEEPSKPAMTTEQVRALQDALNLIYPGIAVLVRDVDLTYEQAAKYEVGMIIREKAHVDVSRRVMGMATSHRFAILSNHLMEPTAKELEFGANWGMRVAKPDSHFKVLGKHTYQGKTCIFLLHLPDDERWKLFINTVIDADADLLRKCIARFEAKCLKAPVADLATPEWMDRCRFPIGMDHNGNFFPLEDPVEEPQPEEQPEGQPEEEEEIL